MSGEELAGLMTQGLIDGLLQGALIMLPYIVGFCLLCLLIGAIKRAFRRSKSQKTPSIANAGKSQDVTGAYQPRALFSPHEKDAYRKLKEIADRRGYIVFTKVRLLDLLEPVKNHSNYRALFNKVQAKHVDFVLCNYELAPYIIIELDDSSHDAPRRKERDRFVDEVLNQCGYRIIHTREITNNILNEAIPQR